MLTELFIDRPIRSENQDVLGRAGLSAALAQIIAQWEGDESLVLAVSGKWGTGKTSLKNLIVEHLNLLGARKPQIAEFNPWRWSSQRLVTKAFFQEIAIALGKVDETEVGRARVARWKRYSNFVTFGSDAAKSAGDLIPLLVTAAGALGFFAASSPKGLLSTILTAVTAILLVLAAIFKFSGGAVERYLNSLESRNAQLDDDGALERRKAELSRDLASLPRSVVVIVDDIDRTSAEEIRTLFQHIKGNADFPNLVYLLLYDEDVVFEALTSPGVSGRDYIQKLVQLPFSLPEVPRPEVQKVLTAGLDKIIGRFPDAPWNRHRWSNLFVGALQYFFPNMRSANRYLSTLSVHVGLFKGAKAFEINMVDLVGIEAVRVFEPEVYRRLASEKGLMTGRSTSRFTQNEEQQRVKSIIELAEPERLSAIEELLKQLFPTIEWALGGTSYSGGEWRVQWRNELRICSPEAFDRYFQLSIPDSVLSESDFIEVVAATANHQMFLTKVLELRDRGVLEDTLSRLDDHAPKIPIKNGAEFLPALFDLGDELSHDSSATIFSQSLYGLRIALRFLGQTNDRRLRASLILKAGERSRGLSLLGSIVDAYEREFLKPESEQNHDVLLVDRNDEIKILELWRQKIRHIASQSPEELLTKSGSSYLLHEWRRLGVKDEVAEWLSSIIGRPQFLLLFLKSVISKSTSSAAGDYVSRSHKAIDIRILEQLIDPNLIEQHLAKLDRLRMSDDDLATIKLFEMAMERRRQGKDGGFFALQEDDDVV